jgi:hypothetical protein
MCRILIGNVKNKRYIGALGIGWSDSTRTRIKK